VRNDTNEAVPRIGITIGDAAGIGPEIALKSLADKETNQIGDGEILLETARKLGLDLEFTRIKQGEDFPENKSSPLIYDLQNIAESFPMGEDNRVTGRAAAENIEIAVRLWKEKKIDAVSTAPISKKAIRLGGYDFPGHTEFLAELTGTEKFAMSFFAGNLRVVLLSTHLSLRDAVEFVKKENLIELIRFSDGALAKLLKKRIKIAVAGLNPHASEGGMFGNEEETEIVPAILECREKYEIDVCGAFSPDTIFLRAFRGEFDAVVSCYHDQATIAVKCLSFGESVNVTLGLPLVRTSVDHGTAFDIAGKNIADASSMRAAIKLAAQLCVN
jgi:4-phospho-D-threonate 3-dehydrogenase / 4-phospho-D-erythronate 3-dehydrogenase